MTIQGYSNNTLTATGGGTEDALSFISTAARVQLSVDLSNMADGDVVEIRTYQQVLTGGTSRVADLAIFYGAQPTDALIYISQPIGNDISDTFSVKFTLKQTFGTPRNFAWKVVDLEGSPAALIWNYLTSSISTVGSIGKLIKDFLDVAVSSRSSHTAADVWASGTRTLTAFGFSVTVGTNNDKTGYSLSSAGIQAIWDALTSVFSTAGSIGKLIKDLLDVAVSSRLASASYASPPSVSAIADGVWDEDMGPHGISGSAGNMLNVILAYVSSILPTASDISTAVWAAASRTLTAFGFNVTVGTNNDKTGYSLAAGQIVVKKNTALNNFEFLMRQSGDHITPATGLTVAAERSIDGAAFAACANAVSEVGSGIYKINLAAADLNGNVITLKFTATGADQRTVTILIQA